MALSMRERLTLQKSVKQSLAALRGGEVGMRERLALQKQVKADMAKLGGQAEAQGAEIPKRAKGEFDRLILPLTGVANGLESARATDRQFNGDGRYAGEYMASEKARDLLASAEQAISERLARIDDAENLKVAEAYINSQRPDLTLTQAEQEWRDGMVSDAPETPPHERIKAAVQGGDASEAMRIAQTLTDKLDLSEALVKAGFSIAGGSVGEILAYVWPQMQEKADMAKLGGQAEAPAPEASGQVDISDIQARLTAEAPMNVAADWVVMNAPRPLAGHETLEGGDFLSGRFYAAIDPKGDNAKGMIEQNRKLDARVVLVATREMQAEMALVGSKYAAAYRELAEDRGEALHEMPDIQNKIDKLNDKTAGELQALMRQVRQAVGEPSQPEVSEGVATLTDQAARGDFNGLALPEFIEQLKSAYSADEDLEGAKEAAIGYLETNQEELEAA
jgi:hypothetical protein